MVNRRVTLRVDQLGVDIPAEITGTISQGKPRLRKDQPNNRSKLHLVPLVMAIARLPDPTREDKTGTVEWPLENKSFVVSHMKFEIVSDDGSSAVLRPLSARILHSDNAFDLQKRFDSLARDIGKTPNIRIKLPELASALEVHRDAVLAATNSIWIRQAADNVIAQQVQQFGESNTAAISTIEELPATLLEEDITGKEGRVLTRLHSYRERDRTFVRKAKALFKAKHGRLFCECCGLNPGIFYGLRGENRIQAHHKTPVEELLPDTETKPEDLAMVCPNCHDIIHAERPWVTVENLHSQLLAAGNHYFK
ncbi:MAG: HNH endonuclease [Armatimonadetes bacterium]|nr:HNH endonuclease [Armatimonadota bacterium]